MGTPFTAQATLSFPPDVSVPAELVEVAFSAQYDQFVWSVMKLTGAGTKAIDFGNIGAPGVKAALIKVDADPVAAPINLQWNGGGAPGEQEIAPGGFFMLGSAVPVSGLTSLSIVYTTAVTVRVLLLG